jgi:hypothetical protein
MTSKRLLASSALFAFLVLAAPAAGQDSGGGVVAPATTPFAEPSAVAPEPAPPAEASQDETPTTPEGEEQPAPEEQPDGEQAPTGEEESVTGGEGVAGGGEAGGGLPQTGFEVAALTSIGLGLLLAGAALRPTSSWPPPRDRLSRSTRRH